MELGEVKVEKNLPWWSSFVHTELVTCFVKKKKIPLFYLTIPEVFQVTGLGMFSTDSISCRYANTGTSSLLKNPLCI